MDELYFDNKKYITTKKAASIANYAKDYVGQLARSGKIDARLIGRNWYISEEALVEHAFGKKENHVMLEPIASQHSVKNDVIAEIGELSDVHQAHELKTRTMESEEQYPADDVSQHDETIRNNGLESIHHADQALYDEMNQLSHIEAGSNQIRYWNDDSDLYPQLPNQVDSGDTEVTQIADEPEDALSVSMYDRQPAISADVSKITLTLRNRLQQQEMQRNRGFSDSIAHAGATTRRSNDVDPEIEAQRVVEPRHQRLIFYPVLTAVALLLVLGFAYYTFTATEINYTRQQAQ